ncbi:MAG: hypothetical protein WCA63_04630 [Gallionella sp.]
MADIIYYTIKVLATAGLIVLAGEIIKREHLVGGALLASLPLASLLIMVWLYLETGDPLKIAALSTGIFWLILPSLVLFLLLPVLIKAGWGFWFSLLTAVLAMTLCYGVMLAILKQFGVKS